MFLNIISGSVQNRFFFDFGSNLASKILPKWSQVRYQKASQEQTAQITKTLKKKTFVFFSMFYLKSSNVVKTLIFQLCSVPARPLTTLQDLPELQNKS